MIFCWFFLGWCRLDIWWVKLVFDFVFVFDMFIGCGKGGGGILKVIEGNCLLFGGRGGGGNLNIVLFLVVFCNVVFWFDLGFLVLIGMFWGVIDGWLVVIGNFDVIFKKKICLY